MKKRNVNVKGRGRTEENQKKRKGKMIGNVRKIRKDNGEKDSTAKRR